MPHDRYRTLVEELPDYAIFMLDERGLVTSWNLGAQRVLGYQPSEVLGGNSEKFFTPQEIADRVPQRLLDEAAAKGRAVDEHWRIRKDGVRICVSGVTIALHDEAQRVIGFAKILHDITDQRLRDDRLAAQYGITEILANAAAMSDATPQILRTICETLQWEWGALWEVQRRENVLRCIEVFHADESSTRRFEEVSRKTPLPRGIGLPGRVWGSREPAWIADVAKDANFPRGHSARAEDLHGGVAFPIGLGGEVTAVIEFISREVRAPDPDLLRLMSTIGSQIGQFIQRKRAEDDLRESEARKGAILEAALDCIIAMNHEGKVVEWNPAAQRVFGYSREQAIGQLLGELIVPPELRKQHYEGLARYLKTGEGPVIGRRIEVPAIRADGSKFPVELAITRIAVAGEPMFTAHLRDITDRASAERERADLLAREKEAREQAESANRAKDEFLATVSHELRTPLTAMLGWAALLQSDSLDPATMQEGLSAIERNTHAQAQLVEDLLDISRIVSGKLSLRLGPIDLAQVVAAAMSTILPAAQAKGIELTSNSAVAGVIVNGDPDRLQQVVWNLLSNAVKFTDAGGRVEVRVERDAMHARINITDTGKGIAANFLPYVFDRFTQADSSRTRKHGGLGLGLAIARQLVELHGGSVAARSEGEGRGATFTVELPLLSTRQRETIAPPSPSFAHDAVLEGLRVLVIDDEPDARRLVGAILEKCSATVIAVASVAEAMSFIAANRPDVVLSDIGLVGEDGYAFIRQLRELEQTRGWKIPAAALTAYARIEDRMRALAAGYQMFIPKPVEPAELVTIVAALAGRRM